MFLNSNLEYWMLLAQVVMQPNYAYRFHLSATAAHDIDVKRALTQISEGGGLPLPSLRSLPALSFSLVGLSYGSGLRCKLPSMVWAASTSNSVNFCGNKFS